MADVAARVWQVGALCRAVADALDARFNPLLVRGEISGFARASSGHCYFSLKDAAGQIRCAMFKRAAGLLDFAPREGDLVEVRGRLGVYEPRGDLQLIVESMRQAGAGALFEQFIQLKLRLEQQGLFDSARKRPLPVMPRVIGVVTSLGAAALYDVVTALQRRAPHIEVVLAPAAVQGSLAPAQLVAALESLYQLCERAAARPEASVTQAARERELVGRPAIDAILLVRGGGSIEDLWAFNDEALARVIARSPVPVLCGVGHETDFTIADFVADVRAPTPTAAAEMVSQPTAVWLGALDLIGTRLVDALTRRLDRDAQRLDNANARMGRPSTSVATRHVALLSLAQRLRQANRSSLVQRRQVLQQLLSQLPSAQRRATDRAGERLARAELRLGLLDPSLVLQRGYAWLADSQGHTVTSAAQTHIGQRLQATLAQGTLDVLVAAKE